MPCSSCALELQDVSYSYPFTDRMALERVSIEIYDGECVGIVGRSGSGKSTMLQLFNGLVDPDSGAAFYGGKRIGCEISKRDVRREVGLVFQQPEFQFFEPTVYDEIAFAPRRMDLPPDEIERRVHSSFDSVGLDFSKFGRRSPFSLSGGEMRSVAIASVLAMNPKVLILDEPTCGLDAAHRTVISGLLRRLIEKGVTVIVATHDIDIVAELSRRLVVLDEGRVVYDGSQAVIFERGFKIERLGLEVPEVVEVYHALMEAGVPVEYPVSGSADAEKAIVDGLKAVAR